MKKLKIVVSILLAFLLFSGCSSFRLASSVDELISPVSPQGNDAAIQNALSAYTNDGYSLKSPSYGEYTSAYIFYDVDNDGEEEAIVFYEAAKDLGLINMAVIDKTGEKKDWQVIFNLTTEYPEVYSIDFSDLTGDGLPELIVLWDVIKNSSSHLFSVYTQKGTVGSGYELTEIDNSLTINYYITVDLKSSGVNNVLAFTIDSGDSVSASATLYSYQNGREMLGKTKLDGHISSYKSIKSDVQDGRVFVFADAVKSNGTQMLTEIIMWSDYYNTVVSPFYSYDTGVTKKTTRKAKVVSCDINGDGLIEVPIDAEYDFGHDDVYAVDWCRYEGSVLHHYCYSIVSENSGYQLVMPEEMLKTIEIVPSDNELTFNDADGNLIFKIMSTAKTDLSAEESNNEVMSNAGYSYIAVLGDSDKNNLTIDEIKEMIKSLD